MIIFASVDDPPVSLFELGIKTGQDPLIEKDPMPLGVSPEDPISKSLTFSSIFPAVAGVMCTAMIIAQFTRMKISKGVQRKS